MSKQTAPARRSGTSPVIMVVVGAVVAAGLLAAVIALLSGSDDDGGASGDGRSDPVAESETGTSGSAAGFDTAVASVQGSQLPPLSDGGDDPAIGMPAPELTGQQLDGSSLTAPAEGRPTMLVFLAHWCPHCQAEVEDLTAWLDDGGPPQGIDLVGVATSITSDRPNHPPSEWLAGEGWDQPAIADADQSAAAAYGLTNLPYWVIVDAEGNVVERRAGTQGEAEFEEMADLARGI